ncbi:mannose-1-phosphate guanylyltransferase [Paenibacillus sp. NPDC058071]|uniref:mannose-1-phosphate guanylyltransferase n=1 Tax=Paenibacillus sp. NPDC058071 TaxID=3346326 RepID=UPI0036DEEFB5
MKAVIMAGGKGTRFWPRSTEEKPKQFLQLASDRATMLQQTYERFRSCLAEEDIYVAVSENYLPLVREQLPTLKAGQLMIEPDQRDTAPCVALAASFLLNRGIDEVIVTAPSDQFIPETAQLMEALRAAESVAEEDETVVTLGIVPTRAETGFGYIAASEQVRAERYGHLIKEVKAFIEKPTKEKAEQLIQDSNIYWNSGIFIWKPSTIAAYMRRYQPQLWSVFQSSGDALKQAYRQLPKQSVDYAIIEKVEKLYTVPIAFLWDDVGTWTSLERIFDTDGEGNLLFGSVYPHGVRRSIVYSENQRIVVIGVEDLIVVSTEHGLLICPKSEEQKVKEAIAALNSDQEDRKG